MTARAERAEKERERRTEELAPLQKEAAVFADAISAGDILSAGLKTDATVEVTNSAEGFGRYYTSLNGWEKITAVFAGSNNYGQCDIS